MNNKYPREEKLKQKNDLDLLFEKGKWKNSGNLRIAIYQNETILQSKIGVSVSKRYFKKATDRNRIKRLLREAYRLNKNKFSQAVAKNNFAMLFWVSSKMPPHYSVVEQEFLALCHHISNRKK